jgi:VIT1/CCC1 family predicted Fe2+/Mn2+ transporter
MPACSPLRPAIDRSLRLGYAAAMALDPPTRETAPAPNRLAGMPTRHSESHRSGRAGWLRAAVLGANDGIVSVSGLVVGVAASGASHETVLASGVAALVAGAMSMAAGEYVSVQSQADTEHADLAIERRELAAQPQYELTELTHIYVRRGLEPALARQVAEQLTAHDALAAHARDELGITDTLRARPVQAAVASAAAFVAGGVLPLGSVLLSPASIVQPVTIAVTMSALFLSGALAARAGGAPMLRGATRVAFWGALAMAASSAVGSLFDVSV